MKYLIIVLLFFSCTGTQTLPQSECQARVIRFDMKGEKHYGKWVDCHLAKIWVDQLEEKYGKRTHKIEYRKIL